MQSHELAERIFEAGVPMEQEAPEFEGVATIIDSSQAVWRQLKEGTFNETEEGHLTINVLDWSDYRESSGDHVDGLELYFNRSDGMSVKIGEMVRTGGGKGKVCAYTASDSKTKEAIGTADGRWEAIVGPITEAIKTCSITSASTT